MNSGDLKSKAEYVKNQGQTRPHTCHWPGCKTQCPPAMWGCKQHWFKLPRRLRDRIWETYRPGQEANMTPSTEYLDTADEVEQWILQYQRGESHISLKDAVLDIKERKNAKNRKTR